MGIFGKRQTSDEAIICSLLVTFAQSIESVEKGNQFALNEAWDIFINTVGGLTDGGVISEEAMEFVLHKGNFPENHSLTLDLLKIRSLTTKTYLFVDEYKRVLGLRFSASNVAAKSNWLPKDFSDVLSQMASKSFPTFGLSEKDQAFSAVLGIFMMTLVVDLTWDQSGMSSRTAKRVVGYELVLRWLAEWNLGK